MLRHTLKHCFPRSLQSREVKAAGGTDFQVRFDCSFLAIAQIIADEQRQLFSDNEATPAHHSFPSGPCRCSQILRNISRARDSRHRMVASRRPSIAATSEQENPSRSLRIKTLR